MVFRPVDAGETAADMPAMPRMALLALMVAAASGPAGSALAQGMAPGGGIANTTGIGNGLGPPGGTGPHYPNATPQPALPAPPPPGGYGAPLRPPTVRTARPPSYPQPTDPFGPPPPRMSGETLRLPEAASGDLTFLDGCWRSDVFRYDHQGVATYCFDEKGTGRFLYRRLDQPTYSCHGSTRALHVDGMLRFHNRHTTCSDGDDSYPANLDCTAAADAPARCSGHGDGPAGLQTWTVRLHRIR
jgi:hypothetical protein